MKFGQWLSLELKKKNLSQRAFSKLCGESQSNISKVILGKIDPTMQFCVSVARGLDVQPAEVIHRAGYRDVLPLPYDKITRDVAETMREMTDQDKAYLLTLARVMKEGRAIYLPEVRDVEDSTD
jgi:transcriptional regulator with XRE-family HTH domain